MSSIAKRIRPEDVDFAIKVEVDDLVVRGNAQASGDDKLDREVENKILRRLDDGDVWAWAFVTVEARYHGLVGLDTLGGCNYNDEDDFRAGGYYDDMCDAALADLQRQVNELAPFILKP